MAAEHGDDKEEVGRRGMEIYRRVVKPQLRPEDKGRLVAIGRGCYGMAVG